MMTPNEIDVLLHFYCRTLPHPRGHAPAVIEAIDRFEKAGAISYVGVDQVTKLSVYEVTGRGRKWVQMICDTPEPIQMYIDPREQRK